nr:MAG TPA: hypothetical protein [Caudoviricetes sp.]
MLKILLLIFLLPAVKSTNHLKRTTSLSSNPKFIIACWLKPKKVYFNIPTSYGNQSGA